MALKIFVSYAYRDKILVDDLRRHLLPLQQQGFIEIWQDSEIAPGGEWSQAIDKHLNTANIVLLMLSPDFLDSDYCYSREMKRTLERHEANEVRVIPIILRPVHWQASPLSKLQALPRDAQPVTSWANRDQAFYNIAEGIRRVAEEIIVHNNIKPTDQNLPRGLGTDETTQNTVTSSSVTPNPPDTPRITMFVETDSEERFQVKVSSNISIQKFAEEFFKLKRYPLVDVAGRAIRLVVSLVTSEEPNVTRRLSPHITVSDAGIKSGDTVTIFPEMVAGCFPLGTLIRMADGKQIPIESIKIDDEVMSWDLGRQRSASASIIGIHKEQPAPTLLLINSQLKLSVSQPVWVNSSWKFARDIKVGDHLMGLSRQMIASHSISSFGDLFDDQQQVVTSHDTSSIDRLFDDQIIIHDISPIDGLFEVRHLSTFGGIPFFAEDILVQPYNAVDTASVGQSVTKQAFYADTSSLLGSSRVQTQHTITTGTTEADPFFRPSHPFLTSSGTTEVDPFLKPRRPFLTNLGSETD